MAAPTYIQRGTWATGTAGVLPVPLPALIEVNDILLLFAGSKNEPIAISGSAGGVWNVIDQGGQGTPAVFASSRIAVWWSRYNGTQTAPELADSGDNTYGRMIAIRGCRTTSSPIDVQTAVIFDAGPDTFTFPSVTTVTPDSMVVLAKVDNYDNTSAGRFANWTNANLIPLTERIDVGTTFGLGGGLGVATGIKATPGATGPTTVTQNTTTSSDSAIVFVLAPIVQTPSVVRTQAGPVNLHRKEA